MEDIICKYLGEAKYVNVILSTSSAPRDKPKRYSSQRQKAGTGQIDDIGKTDIDAQPYYQQIGKWNLFGALNNSVDTRTKLIVYEMLKWRPRPHIDFVDTFSLGPRR